MKEEITENDIGRDLIIIFAGHQGKLWWYGSWDVCETREQASEMGTHSSSFKTFAIRRATNKNKLGLQKEGCLIIPGNAPHLYHFRL